MFTDTPPVYAAINCIPHLPWVGEGWGLDSQACAMTPPLGQSWVPNLPINLSTGHSLIVRFAQEFAQEFCKISSEFLCKSYLTEFMCKSYRIPVEILQRNSFCKISTGIL